MTSLELIKKSYERGLSHSQVLSITLRDDNKWQQRLKNRNSAFREVLTSYVKSVQETAEIINYVGSALLFLNDDQDEYASSFDGVGFSAEKCSALAGAEDVILRFHLDQQIKLNNQILYNIQEKGRLSHTIRRSALDQTIKNLLLMRQPPLCDLVDRKMQAQALSLSYLMRSRIIRQKGFSVPAKKIEGFQQALEALAFGYSKYPGDIEYLRIKSLILLEQDKIKATDSSGLEQCLKSYFGKLGIAGPDKADYPLILWYARKTNCHAYLDHILADGEPIEKLESAILLNCSSPEITGYANETITDLSEKPFSHDDWKTIVAILKAHPGLALKDITIALWDAARQRESITTSNCHLRWYWSQQQDIYEMAFHAADEASKKAEIADSLKGRPVLKRQAVEELARNDKSLKKYIDDQDAGWMGYIPKFKPAPSTSPPKKLKKTDNISQKKIFIATPQPWIAVHFFITTDAIGKKKGYAMVHDSQKNDQNNCWITHGPFNLDIVWSQYMIWQESYHRLGACGGDKNDSAPYMKKLCESIGKELSFLFVLPREQPVVFIPNGFLHLVPIHMAIDVANSEKNPHQIWAYKRKFTYLPAWSLIGSDHGSASPYAASVQILKYFEEGEYNYNKLRRRNLLMNDQASSSDILALQNTSSHLFLLCHGTANPNRPFDSGLKLKNGRLTIREILSMPRIPGMAILLGACETDMVGATASPLDEHISVSTSFLERGANEVIGGLFELRKKYTEDVALAIHDEMNNKYLYQIFTLFLSKKIDQYIKDKKCVSFYEMAAFRPLGLQSTVKSTPLENSVLKTQS